MQIALVVLGGHESEAAEPGDGQEQVVWGEVGDCPRQGHNGRLWVPM